MSLVIPHAVLEEILGVLRTHHPEHVHAIERSRGIDAGTNEAFTFDVLAYPGARQIADHPAPVALLGFVQPVEMLDRQDQRWIDWQLLCEIYVEGPDRRDVLLRRDVAMMTIAECLETRVPRSERLDRLEVVDFATGDQQTEDGGGISAIGIIDVSALLPAWRLDEWPPANTDLAPGSPGGPPDGLNPMAPPPTLDSVEDETDLQ